MFDSILYLFSGINSQLLMMKGHSCKKKKNADSEENNVRKDRTILSSFSYSLNSSSACLAFSLSNTV